MNRYEIDESQLARLRNIAVAIRNDPDPTHLAQYGYDIEAVIGECQNSPIADDEETYGKQSDEEDEPDNNGGSEEEL